MAARIAAVSAHDASPQPAASRDLAKYQLAQSSKITWHRTGAPQRVLCVLPDTLSVGEKISDTSRISAMRHPYGDDRAMPAW